MSVNYQEIKVYKEKDVVVAENGTNVIKFYGCSFDDIGKILRKLLEDDPADQ